MRFLQLLSKPRSARRNRSSNIVSLFHRAPFVIQTRCSRTFHRDGGDFVLDYSLRRQMLLPVLEKEVGGLTTRSGEDHE